MSENPAPRRFAGVPTSHVRFLRDRAHECARLARDCSDPAVARALETMSFQLLEKAGEIEAALSIPPAETPEH